MLVVVVIWPLSPFSVHQGMTSEMVSSAINSIYSTGLKVFFRAKRMIAAMTMMIPTILMSVWRADPSVVSIERVLSALMLMGCLAMVSLSFSIDKM